MTGAESKPVYTYTITELVEDARTFIGRNKTDDPIPAPNSCAACGAQERYHATSWVNRPNGTGDLHRYEAPSNALRLARMRARRVR